MNNVLCNKTISVHMFKIKNYFNFSTVLFSFSLFECFYFLFYLSKTNLSYNKNLFLFPSLKKLYLKLSLSWNKVNQEVPLKSDPFVTFLCVESFHRTFFFLSFAKQNWCSCVRNVSFGIDYSDTTK